MTCPSHPQAFIHSDHGCISCRVQNTADRTPPKEYTYDQVMELQRDWDREHTSYLHPRD